MRIGIRVDAEFVVRKKTLLLRVRFRIRIYCESIVFKKKLVILSFTVGIDTKSKIR